MIIMLQFSLLILLLLNFAAALAQSPAPAPAPTPAAAPAPHGPTNVVKILKKAGEFKTFVTLLKKTQLDSNLNSQLGNANNGLTIFAPSDTAFSTLKKGTLKTLTNQEKVELVQFHIIPTYISTSMFDTISNPLKTHAGSGNRFQFNVTSSGNSVHISTGLTNTTISDTVYIDNNLAIYKVDKVLLPLDIFTPKPASAPAPEIVKEKSPDDDDDDQDSDKVISGVVTLGLNLVFMVGVCMLNAAMQCWL